MAALVLSHPWIYPALETLHLMGLAALFGGLLIFELRMLGRATALDPSALARLSVPVALAGFALCAVTGVALFSAHADELWVSNALRLKMALILIAGANALWFHWRGGVRAQDRMARWQCLLSLGLWVTVIVCGRWIAVV
ncbi:hypothetical protein CDN99_00140 [Roseateles aquatilis]|uniref:Copper resistance protein D domain-containing protein n=1 Tax=Roseateles aquatilis TaxID=431061 RepID=A0A246JMP2_9BURK|nr:hypothetical protein CDN99_00140 [Roseateles aquatilis]